MNALSSRLRRLGLAARRWLSWRFGGPRFARFRVETSGRERLLERTLKRRIRRDVREQVRPLVN